MKQKLNLWDRFKLLIKSLTKPARLEPRQTELPEFGTTYGGFGSNPIMDVFSQMVSLIVVTIFLVALSAAAAMLAFTPNGWASLIGQLLADVCRSQNICDLPGLLSGFAVGNIILIYLVILTALAFDRLTWAHNNIDEDQIEAVNETNEVLNAHFNRLREQNQTIMAMLFMVADEDTKGRMADMFTETLDDEESKALSELIEEHEREAVIDEAIAEAKTEVAELVKDQPNDIPRPF